MRAVVCESPGDLRLVERPIPEAGPGDVLPRWMDPTAGVIKAIVEV
ncbi:MAG TPA: hypothetical protein VF774_29055 [Pseudoduganella sp.]